MGVIKKEEIAGYTFWGCLEPMGRKDEAEIVCTKCVKEADLEGLTFRDILTTGTIREADEKFFCDRCAKMLSERKRG